MGGSAATGVICYWSSGAIWRNGGSAGVSITPPLNASNVLCCAVDLDNRNMWFRVGSGGAWSGASGNPATNTGGVPIPAGTMVPFVVFGGASGVAGSAVTANFGASAFAGAVPAGFTAGWTGGTPSGYVELSGSGGAGGTPGGADTQIQYNKAGAFAGDAKLTWNDTTFVINVNGQLTATGVIKGVSFVGAGTSLTMSTELTNGAILLRPNGPVSTTGQVLIDNVGTVTVKGPVVLPADPASALQAVTKQYVDNKIIRYDAAQALTAAQQLQARQNIFAAPLDALAYNGMQINGSMEISQEKAIGTATTTYGQYICDGWIQGGGGAPVISSSVVVVGSGIANAIRIAVTTAVPSLAAGDGVNLSYRLEGFRVSRLAWGSGNAQPLTIAFWVNCHRPGTYTVSVRTGTGARSYVTTYTVSAADTWEYKTVTIPGDTAGTWAVDNTTGMSINFSMASGSTNFVPSLNTWTVGNYVSHSSQVNAVAATSDIFQIAAVIVLPGSEAPSAARASLIMRPADQELMTCQRYFETGYFQLDGYTGAAGIGIKAAIPFRIVKRAAPTAAISNPVAVGMVATANFSATAGITYLVGLLGTTTGAGGYIGQFNWTADTRL